MTKRGSGLSYGEIKDRLFMLPPKIWTVAELAAALGIAYNEARATLSLMKDTGLAVSCGNRPKAFQVIFPR